MTKRTLYFSGGTLLGIVLIGGQSLYALRIGFTLFDHIREPTRISTLIPSPSPWILGLGIGVTVIALILMIGLIGMFVWFLRKRSLKSFLLFFGIFFLSILYHISFFPGMPLHSGAESLCRNFSYDQCPISCGIGPSYCSPNGFCTADVVCKQRENFHSLKLLIPF